MSDPVRPPPPPKRVHRLPRRASVKLSIDLDDALAARLDEAIVVVAESRAAVEMGVVIDRARVARIAMIRGLDALLDAGWEPEVSSVPLRAPVASEPPSPAKPPSTRGDGTLSPPAGWVTQERDPVPTYQHDVHAHYEAAGWDRWLVWIGEKDWAYAYWCDRAEGQDGVLPWPGATVVQLGMQGTAHMISAYHGRD